MIRVSIPQGAAEVDGNLSEAGAFEFLHRSITSAEDGLVAWYDFENSLGSTILDQSGNMRNGTYLSTDLSSTDHSNIETSETNSTSYPSSNAFDNKIAEANDKWLADWNGTFVNIKYNFGTSTEISSYAVYSQNADEEFKSPKSWLLHGSNNDSDWTLIDTVNNQIDWGEWERRIFSLSEIVDYQFYRLTFTEITGSSQPLDFEDLAVWFDASDLDADGLVDTSSETVNITSWMDKGPNNYHALSASGSPTWVPTGGPHSKQVVEIRGGDYLPISGNFFAKDHFYVFRSPPENEVWSFYGGVLGHNPASGNTQRNSNYITQHNQTYFHSKQFPQSVWKFGTSLSSPFDLAPINEFMVLRLQVNDNAPGPYESYQIGRATGLQCFLDISEIIAFKSALSSESADRVEGYLAHKWGLSENLPTSHPLKYLSIGEIEFYPPPQSESGLFGNAIGLSGQSIELPFRIDQSSSSSGMTVAAWIRPDSISAPENSPLILVSTDNGGSDWSLGFKNGYPFVRSGKLELTTSHQVYAGEWMHMVGVFNPRGSRSTVYLDGNPAILKSLGFDSSTATLYVGSDANGSHPYDGLIDDLRVWSRALSSDEIEELYGNGLGDINPNASVIVQTPTYDANLPASLQFNKEIYGFDPSTDLNLTGLTLTNWETEDNVSFTLNLAPVSFSPSSLSVGLFADSVSDSFGSTNHSVTRVIDYRPHRVAESDLLLWWELNGNLNDSSGNGHIGTSSSPDWNSSGIFENCISMDSVDGRSVVHSGLSNDLPNATLSVWIYPKSENFHLFESDASSQFLTWMVEKKRLLFSITGLGQNYLPGGPADIVHSRKNLSLHQWHHLALTYNLEDRSVSLFLDGILDTQSNFSGTSPLLFSSPFRLGPPDQIDSTLGEIDDFRIYKKALSADEIYALHGGGIGDFNSHTIELSYSENINCPFWLMLNLHWMVFPLI